jgi:hypothetical protein
MAARAAIPAVAVALVAFVVGLVARGPGTGLSALGGVVVVTGTFVVYVLVLGWARSVGPGVLQGVVLGGWLLRLGVFVGTLFALRPMDWFDAPAFGFAGIAGALAVTLYETKLWLGGLGAGPEPDARLGAARR